MGDILHENIKKWLEDTTKELYLSGLELIEWPKQLVGKEHLIIELNCCDNKLTSLPNNLINLKKLDCAVNQLTNLPACLNNLEYLSCAYNYHLTSLPHNLTNLKDLRCDNSRLTCLPNSLINLKKLTCNDYLDITDYETIEIHLEEDEEIVVDLSNQGLTKWPKHLVGKEHLIIKLDCSENKLTSLPNNLINLKSLICFDNKLTSLPNCLNNLEYLNCAYNIYFTSLPNCLNNLKELNCEDCGLTSLPNNLTNLKELYCNDNRLTSLPDSLTNLEELCCYHNNIKALPYLPKLNELDMFTNYPEPISEEKQNECYFSLYQKMIKKELRIKELEDMVEHLRYRPGGPGYEMTLSHFNHSQSLRS